MLIRLCSNGCGPEDVRKTIAISAGEETSLRRVLAPRVVDGFIRFRAAIREEFDRLWASPQASEILDESSRRREEIARANTPRNTREELHEKRVRGGFAWAATQRRRKAEDEWKE